VIELVCVGEGLGESTSSAHGTHGVRTGGPDAYFVEVEETGLHRIV
jgi:hypothetical protein